MRTTVLIAGASGLVGTRLKTMLLENHYNVITLSRKASPKEGIFGWHPETGKIDDEAILQADYVINLAGSGIADGRWTAQRKTSIINSRVMGAKVLHDAFIRTGKRPRAYLSASAVGYYGNTKEKLVHEDDLPLSDDFKSKTSVLWEAAASEMENLEIRTVILRIGIVLTKNGGALPEMAKSLRFGLGAYFADGQAWYPWIHCDDICNMFIWAITNDAANGIYNGVAPNPTRNLDLIKAAAIAQGQRAIFLPIPAFILRLFLGEMADILLDSTKASSEKIEKAGYRFLFPEVQGALSQIYKGSTT